MRIRCVLDACPWAQVCSTVQVSVCRRILNLLHFRLGLPSGGGGEDVEVARNGQKKHQVIPDHHAVLDQGIQAVRFGLDKQGAWLCDHRVLRHSQAAADLQHRERGGYDWPGGHELLFGGHRLRVFSDRQNFYFFVFYNGFFIFFDFELLLFVLGFGVNLIS